MDMVMDMAMAMLASPMLPTPIISTARGRLSPSLRLRLSTDTPMLLPMLDIMAMLATPMLTTESPTAMARGRLRPSLRLRLSTDTTPMLLPLVFLPTVSATPMLTKDTDTTARGLLRPSPRLTAMATDPLTDTPTLVPTPTVAMAVDTTGDKSSDHGPCHYLTRLWTTDQCSIFVLL